MTPFGRPVVPEVYINRCTSSWATGGRGGATASRTSRIASQPAGAGDEMPPAWTNAVVDAVQADRSRLLPLWAAARNEPEPARLISAVNRIFKHSGLNDLEQIEDAPEYRPGVKVTPELVEQFLTGKLKVSA